MIKREIKNRKTEPNCEEVAIIGLQKWKGCTSD